MREREREMYSVDLSSVKVRHENKNSELETKLTNIDISTKERNHRQTIFIQFFSVFLSFLSLPQ